MRIRSIRPEFWSSEDIAAMDWHTRLVYIGLWSYVDDNGVGRDNERLIVADLFPLDEDLTEASLRVQGALKHLEAAGNITRYTVNEKRYLHVTAWSTHQKINRPSGSRYPLPTTDDAENHDTLTEGSVSAQWTPATGEGEKGRRGEGEKGDSDYVGTIAAVTEPTAQTIVAEWIDRCQQRPPGRVIGHASREVKAMLDEGIPADTIRSGMADWMAKGQHPSTLPSFVNAAANATPQRKSGGGHDFTAALQRAIERDRISA